MGLQGEDGKLGASARAVSRPGLVLTAVGPDRKGLVKDIAAHVRKLGGNIEDTRMSRLGGEFAMLLLVTGEESALVGLKESLSLVEPAWGVTCFVKDTAATRLDQGGTTYLFKVSGVDHPGIVESVTNVLSARSVNVNSLASWLENAPLSGTPMFMLEAAVQLPEDIDLSSLRADLDGACEREDVEYSLSPVTS